MILYLEYKLEGSQEVFLLLEGPWPFAHFSTIGKTYGTLHNLVESAKGAPFLLDRDPSVVF